MFSLTACKVSAVNLCPSWSLSNTEGNCVKDNCSLHPHYSDTGLDQVHYTWAGAAVLEALCLVYPTVNFVLADSDCVPTSLFEVAELVNLMTDRASRAEAMQHYTMASSSQCPTAVLLMTESKAELNAGLIIVTGHTAALPQDVDVDPEAPDASMPPASADHSDACDVFEFIATQWSGENPLCLGKSCGFSGWALAPFAVCFAVSGETQIWLGDLRPGSR